MGVQAAAAAATAPCLGEPELLSGLRPIDGERIQECFGLLDRFSAVVAALEHDSTVRSARRLGWHQS
eukprot:CAMPEP_0204148960 /NCGR_PEP_ID=MMETSP0361-20130328/23993_1 /ASSEMBLY_ACC=CAM_ASM_000343 /TAXON_ID=268821 /ORGANISM="Scrippsiella Hangoei, Strain SHTV-5" /LENGTH=66 /DNA_ID=CAMNT_0051103389 /DNA_START=1 /DNA_END=197 /DNA_ORIENTATION=-